MSDSIEIDGVYNINTGRDKITITPDLARQIVALACDVSEEQQFPPEARIAPAKLILNPSGTMHMAQSIDTTRQIGPGIVDARHSVNDHDCKKGAAHQADLEKAHAGEDAAIVGLMGVTHTACGYTDDSVVHISSLNCLSPKDAARAILAAIRAGKVPLPLDSVVQLPEPEGYSTTIGELISSRKANVARVAELEAARIAYASEFDGDVGNIHASIKALKADLTAEREEYEALRMIGRGFAEKCDQLEADLAAERGKHAESRALWRDTMVERTAERDAARAVARLNEISEIDKAYQRLTAERDRALERVAELEAEVNRRSAFTPVQVQSEVDSWSQKLQAAQVSVECGQKRIAKLEADLAAEWEKNTYRHCTCDDNCDSPCPIHYREVQLQNERDAARAEVTELRKDVSSLKTAVLDERERHGDTCTDLARICELFGLDIQKHGAVEPAVAALRAEVAALKARKVKLPKSFNVTNFWQGCIGVTDTIVALRAAGMEVDCE